MSSILVSFSKIVRQMQPIDLTFAPLQKIWSYCLQLYYQLSQSINHKSLCSMATARLEMLHNAVWQSRGEIRWWDLDTTGWRAMTWGDDWRRNDVNDWADVVSAGRAFQMRGAATEKARLPTVESLTEGTTMRLVPAERSVRRHSVSHRSRAYHSTLLLCF